MPTVTLNLVSPAGVPLAVTLAPGDEGPAIAELVSRAEKIAARLLKEGWEYQPIKAQGAGPAAEEFASGPHFCGFPCSPTMDEMGMPTWIISDGHQATRRSKQGDHWYSYRIGEEYVQVLRIPKGEKVPPVEWRQPPAPAAAAGAAATLAAKPETDKVQTPTALPVASGNEFENIPDALESTREEFNALGLELYTDRWPIVRSANVRKIRPGTEDHEDLTVPELRKIIAGMKAVQAQRPQPDAQGNGHGTRA
jgi:hypothetical protein